MPRKPRVEFEGAVYHVMCRGDHREPIVQDDADRSEFLHCLEEACEKTQWQLHAYVLMGNHSRNFWPLPWMPWACVPATSQGCARTIPANKRWLGCCGSTLR
jgi:hypothetical protein